MTPRLRAEEVGVMMALDAWHEKTGVRYFGKLSRKTNEEKHHFGLIKGQNIGRHLVATIFIVVYNCVMHISCRAN